MSKITSEDVLKLAKLCQINLTKEEIGHFQKDLEEILNYVEVLNKVEVDDLRPTYQVTGLSDVTRSDEIIEYGYTTEDLLKNAPEVQSKQFKVKRVLG